MNTDIFSQIQSETDIPTLAENIIKETSPSDVPEEKFWEKTEKSLISAVCYILWKDDPQGLSISTITEMIKKAAVRTEDGGRELDGFYSDLPEDNFGLRQYAAFRCASPKTADAIVVSVLNRLEKL